VWSYFFNRLYGLAPTVLVISAIGFLVFKLTPGDPAVMLLLQQGLDPTAEAVLQVQQELGLDRPYWQQYGLWLSRVVRGDLGQSYFSQQSVLSELLYRVPATLELTLAAMGFAFVVALGVGMLAALRPGSGIDRICRILAALSVSIPAYWLGLILILLVAVKGQWLPPVGRDGLANLILPAVSLGLVPAAIHSRLLAVNLVEAARLPHTELARAKGLTEWQILRYHSLPLSLTTLFTSFGNTFGHLLGGAVIIETIFAWPGLGKLLMDAIFNRDYPLIHGYVLMMAFLFTLVNLAVDLLCAWLDPRIRAGRGASR
jgi:ABC-type dipeptide/oligopeptide/nickel transport system permease component